MIFGFFEEKLSFIDHEVSVLEAYIDQVETKGHVVSKSYYEELLKEINNIWLPFNYYVLYLINYFFYLSFEIIEHFSFVQLFHNFLIHISRS